VTLTRARMCAGKKQHPSRAQAMAHLHRMVRRGAHERSFNVYECSYCDGWHVGHTPGAKRRAP